MRNGKDREINMIILVYRQYSISGSTWPTKKVNPYQYSYCQSSNQ